MGGITLTGKCPASYNTVDKSVVVEQCPDGVTSIRYCSPINVTIDTKGQAMMAAVEDEFYLHVPLETGAWQVRVYEDGEARSVHSEVGDLMQALKFDDAKNTTFTVTVSFTLPAKQASGKFNANLVAADQSKSDYMCLDVKYAFAATPSFVTEIMNMVTEMSNGNCTKDSDCPSSYCNNGFCHGCFDQCCEADSDCTKKGMSYCAKDSTKMPPYFCHA